MKEYLIEGANMRVVILPKSVTKAMTTEPGFYSTVAGNKGVSWCIPVAIPFNAIVPAGIRLINADPTYA